ncbi:carbon-nitrogen hydrolase family protein [Ammoniphilus sp. CFH 90114]|uniref:carbon-nitrogen hydrolase family protein n=1 Tax=Ammoniphilus sp. CFH 90114 TaxID=2493665 RepID=UPI00100E93D6|nr:carbon-nitrogen hydrolase family protein [Ammoniphilus sp. CFH 90114]RXT07265.1 carbon-nitrogen hydrolase family protein [Ammoniphilus sp. CFH 90114]
MATWNLGLAQLRSNLFEKEANIRRVLETMAMASANQANYVLFPELYTTGYFLGDRVYDLAETVEEDTITRVREQARRLNTGAIVGFPERVGEKIYNSAAFIGRQGEILGTYRKSHLFDHEKEYFSAGEKIPVFDTPEGKFGIMITYDMEFPEMARVLAIKGAQIILILSSNMIPYQPYQHIYLRARAIENHVFVATANKVGLENDTLFFGESEIIHPTGTSLYKSLNNEDLAVVPITLNETTSSKGVLNYMENRRPDLYNREGL